MLNSLYKLFEHKCVLEVCAHDKNPPSVFFLIPILKSPFSNQAVLRFLSEWRSYAHNSWLTRPSYLILQSLLRCRGRQECLRLSDWGVLLLDVIMNIAVIIYSWHLSRWRHRGLMLLSVLRECADNLHKCIYVRANHSWSSFIYTRIKYEVFVMNPCKSPFLIMC